MLFKPKLKPRTQGDLRAMGVHAITVYAGQIAIMGFGVTDTIVAGRHSELSLAALSIASAVFITVFVSLMGLVTALLPIWAEMHGARRPEAIGPSIRQTLYICTGASAVGMLVLFNPAPIFRWTEIPQDLQPVVASYLAVIGWSLPAALLFRVYSTLNQSIGKPQLVSWLQVAALVVKAPLSVAFTFGLAGLPELGIVGCAWATFIVNFFLLGLALVLLLTQRLYVPLQLWRRLEAPNRRVLGEFSRLGVPAALTILVEITSFTLMALFIARLGTTSAAAHQIAANVTAVLFMTPLSLAVAASARVGYWRGAGDEARARAVALQAFRVSLLLGLSLAGLLFVLRHRIVGVYTADVGVALMAAHLLAWIAFFHVADSVQTVAIFVLRCYRVTMAPMVVYCLLLWGVGLGGGYALAYRGVGPWPARFSPVAFWQAAAVGLTLTAIVVHLLLRWASQRKVATGGMPAVPARA